MPRVQPTARDGGDGGGGGGGGGSRNEPGPSHACTDFVANAPVYGDCFQWHVDADPASFPPGPWRDVHGDYDNGAAGRPLFVSLLLYLDETWRCVT
jgi:hypothetical protein